MTPRRPVLLFAALCLLSGNVFSDAGKNGFEFLGLTRTARQSGMAGAGVALADDLGTASKNPAALGRVRRDEVSLTSLRFVESGSYNAVRYGKSFRASGGMGVEVHRFDFGDFDRFDAGGLKSGKVEAGDTMMVVGYGRPVGRAFFAGARFKQIKEQIAGYSGETVALDGGLLFVPLGEGPLSHWRFGTALKNVGAGASFDKGNTSLPRSLSLGAAGAYFSEALVVALDYERISGESPVVAAGGELWLNRQTVLRAGYARRDDFSDGLRVGLGFRFKDFTVDYALETNNSDFADSHRLGISFRFGGPADALYQEGVRFLREENYGEAILTFHEVLEINPDHRGAMERLREAAEALKARKAKHEGS